MQQYKNKKIVLGLSGGPDSIFLFHLLLEAKQNNILDFVAAHLDHEWRQNSYKDLEFCKKLCEKNDIKFFGAKASELNAKIKYNGSKEEAGRKLRRFFFEKILQETKSNFIALAHHAQDQQETFFMRLLRGASLSGLTCMKEIDGQYIRPLLHMSKDEILLHLHNKKIKYLTDESNNSEDFLRNRIRKNVIPAIKLCDERFDKKFESSLKQLQEAEQFLEKLAQDEYKNIFTDKNSGNIKKFLELDAVIQRRLLIKMLCNTKSKFTPSQAHLNEMLKFLRLARAKSHILGNNWKIIKHKGFFFIEKTV